MAKKKDEDEVIEVGPFVTEAAQARGMDPEDFAYSMLGQVTQILVEDKHGNQEQAMFIPGHTVADKETGRYGPGGDVSSDVMVIGKMPWKEERYRQRLFEGSTGEILAKAFDTLNINYNHWYLTNVVRFMPPDGKKKFPVSWQRECRWFLEKEIELVKPKCLLLLGSEAVKALMGRKATLTKYRGVDDISYKGIPIVVTYHPSAVVAEPKYQAAFNRDLDALKSKVSGLEVPKMPTRYETIETEERLKELTDELVAKDHTHFAVDAEWGGTERSNPFQGKLRSVQFATEPGVGYCVLLRGPELVDSFQPNPKAAYGHLKRLFCRPNVQLCGHSLRADAKWLLKECGIDVLPYFAFDTMLAYHLRYPHEDGFGLEKLTLRYSDLGRYDLRVEEWLTSIVAKDKRKAYLTTYGYANVPNEILCPYGIKDVDAPMRAWPILLKELQDTVLPEAYEMPGVFQGAEVKTLYDFYKYIEHPANFPLNEIESEGLPADKDRLMSLVKMFAEKFEELKADLQKETKWPELNPRSPDQLKELMFGEQPIKGRKRPEGATTLKLTPIKTTDKPSKDWGRVKAEDFMKGRVSPSTDGESVKILLEGCTNPRHKEILKQVQRIKGVDQVAKNFLRSPELNPFSGNHEWLGGLVSEIDTDGRIRTTMLQLTETGRYSSSHPNLQNLPKQQEAALRRAFSPDEEALVAIKGWAGLTCAQLKAQNVLHQGYYPIRSCFMAPPGHVLIEADYEQAELNVLAYLSRDETMMETMNDPLRDLHSEMAITAFGLECESNEVKKLWPHLRVLAKAANFGSELKCLDYGYQIC